MNVINSHKEKIENLLNSADELEKYLGDTPDLTVVYNSLCEIINKLIDNYQEDTGDKIFENRRLVEKSVPEFVETP